MLGFLLWDLVLMSSYEKMFLFTSLYLSKSPKTPFFYGFLILFTLVRLFVLYINKQEPQRLLCTLSKL